MSESEATLIAYLVDEERRLSDILSSALRMEGYIVRQFFNATDALVHIRANKGEAMKAVMFIDMCMDPGADTEIFSERRTNQYWTTGLVLAEHLISENLIGSSNLQRRRVVLYTAHASGEVWMSIKRFCDAQRTRKWRKRPNASLSEFIAFLPTAEEWAAEEH